MKFKVYRSSAGSGKTFTLTKEFLKLALCGSGEGFLPDYYRSILAVTFTNDAAGEMKERIVKSLAEISLLGPNQAHPLLDLLYEEALDEYPGLNVSKPEIVKRAARVYKHLLHNYSDFSISTIDAFNNKVVSSFTKELGLPASYEITFDTDEVLDEAVYKKLSRVGAGGDPALSRVIAEFSRKQAEESQSWQIKTQIKEFGTRLFNEEDYEMILRLRDMDLPAFAEAKTQLSEFTGNLENSVTEAARQLLTEADALGLSTEDFPYGKSGYWGLALKTAGGDMAAAISDEFPKRAAEAYQNDVWTTKSLAKDKKISIENLVSSLQTFFGLLLRLREGSGVGEYIIAKTALENIYLLATINETDRLVQQIKKEKGLVFIGDFNRKINEVVSKEPVPFIYERIGERYKHILIDEFQDTSQMQWHNLMPLVINALGQGKVSMIVGDAKQSIYRWRGGKSELIVELPRVSGLAEGSAMATDCNIFEETFLKFSLDTNRRSLSDIIAFNNGFFRFLMGNYSDRFPEINDYYEEVEQKTTGKMGGKVRMDFLFKGEGYEAAVLDRVLALVRQAQANGRGLGEIAVLIRKRDHSSLVAQHLLRNGIEVISDEALLLSASQKVSFLVNMLGLIENPSDAGLFYEALGFLRRKHGQGDNDEDLEDIIKVCKAGSLSRLADYLNKRFSYRINFDEFQFVSIYEVCEELIRRFGLHRDAEEQVFVQAFLDMAADFGIRKNNILASFLEYWEKRKDKLSIASPKSADAVRIMTVHKSKGLQFPVVILPFAHWDTKPHNQQKAWLPWENSIAPALQTVLMPLKNVLNQTRYAEYYQRELSMNFLDATNILYVALTRAEDELYIVSQVKENEKKGGELLEAPKDTIAEPLYLYARHKNLPPYMGSEEEARMISFVVFDGEIPAKKAAGEAKENRFELNGLISTQCRDKIRFRRSGFQLNGEDFNLSELFSAQKYGILVHHALENTLYITDLEKSINGLINAGLISSSEKSGILEKLQKICSLPLVKPYFDPASGYTVLNEKEIISFQKGRNKRSLRPDRLLLKDGKAVIIDYKTGREETAKHKEQLKGYADALAEMGYGLEKAILLYTEIPKAVEVGW